jgi:4a-hydroxytetrahydrobiopterin dehydratase
MAAMNENEIREALGKLPGWTYSANAIHKEFKFETFVPAMAFVNRVAEAAELAQHHPDITIRYSVVSISLSTHSAGGVTAKDFSLAAQLEALAPASP